MKKILMLVTMIMMLAVSAVCSASNGKVLDAEEAIVDKFINGGNYKAVTSMMTEDMQKNWDEKAYNNLHAQLAKDFGKLTTNQLIVVEKHNGADVLLYQVAAEKKPAARFVYLFKLNGEKPLLNDFSVMLPQQKEAAKEEAKKSDDRAILWQYTLSFLVDFLSLLLWEILHFLMLFLDCALYLLYNIEEYKRSFSAEKFNGIRLTKIL